MLGSEQSCAISAAIVLRERSAGIKKAAKTIPTANHRRENSLKSKVLAPYPYTLLLSTLSCCLPPIVFSFAYCSGYLLDFLHIIPGILFHHSISISIYSSIHHSITPSYRHFHHHELCVYYTRFPSSSALPFPPLHTASMPKSSVSYTVFYTFSIVVRYVHVFVSEQCSDS